MIKNIIILIAFLCQLKSLSQNYKLGKISNEELIEKKYQLDSLANAVYLFKKREINFVLSNEGTFNIITKVHERIKIYNKKGLNKASFNLKYYTPVSEKKEEIYSIKGYTYNINDGKIAKVKLGKQNIFTEKKNKFWSVKKIVFPNVNEGSVIDLQYEKSNPFYSIDEINFQFDIPVKEFYCSTNIPEYYNYGIRSKGDYYITPKVVKKFKSETLYTKGTYRENDHVNDNFYVVDNVRNVNTVEYESEFKEYIAENIPRLKGNEPYINNINNYRGGISLELKQINFLKIGGSIKNYTTTWDAVSSKILESFSFGEELNKSNYYKKELRSIIANSKTELEKIVKVYEFVKAKVKWNGYRSIYTDKGVKKAFKERIGNVAEINLMLTSMLKSEGLDAFPVLVSTKDHQVPLFPTLDGFNYVVSLVVLKDGKTVLLDATEAYSIPNVIPERALNWKGRVIKSKKESFWIDLMEVSSSKKENVIIIKFDKDLVANGKIRTKYEALNALRFRRKNNQIKKENLISKFEDKNNLEVIDFELENKNNINKPVLRNVKFKSEDFVEEVNNKLYIEPLLFLTKHKNPFKINDRKFPVEFNSKWGNKNSVIIEIPEGYVIEKIPSSLAIGLPDKLGVFRYKILQIGKNLQCKSSISFNKSTIPVSYYQALKDFYTKVIQKESEKIVLIKN